MEPSRGLSRVLLKTTKKQPQHHVLLFFVLYSFLLPHVVGESDPASDPGLTMSRGLPPLYQPPGATLAPPPAPAFVVSPAPAAATVFIISPHPYPPPAPPLQP